MLSGRLQGHVGLHPPKMGTFLGSSYKPAYSIYRALTEALLRAIDSVSMIAHGPMEMAIIISAT
jgi:hypothetical protein